MAAALTNENALGLPVEIGHIERELSRIWEDAGESKVRASLLNLVIYCERPEALAENTAVLSEIAGRHACRAILILADPRAAEPGARAWINAHCQLVGGRQICSEQITFHLGGASVEALPGIVFSHLDSDLPLCFWWQAPLREPVTDVLWSWVDRLLFDSATWDDASGQLAIVRHIGNLGHGRTILGDLNWTRILGIRFAIAGLFDHAHALENLPSLDAIEITHAPGFRTTALLLLGWFAAKMRWRPAADHPALTRADGELVPCHLKEVVGPPISRCQFRRGAAAFTLEHVGDAFVGSVASSGCEEAPRVFAVPRESVSDLLIAELSRGGRHGNYREAVEIAAHWFPSAHLA